MRFGMFFLAEFVAIVFTSAIMVTVFFGGWELPGLYFDGFHLGAHVFALPHAAVLLIQIMVWGMKVMIFCWLQLMIRWTLPRVRPDQLMSLGWKKLLPVSLVNIVVTAAVVLILQARGH
jgi:NADH-quinone oxidoreductase subunit H